MSIYRSMVKEDLVEIYNGMDFLGESDGKESACNSGDLGLTSGSGRSLREGNGKPL